jgi:hypothetical protein
VAQLALTTVLSHFPDLETKLELLGSGYNVDLTKGHLEAFWTPDVPGFRISVIMGPCVSCS